ncbi:uncharacterized protein [Triticum aestivum]|uniref:uncharacterized protein n=1 Tax=Triticum aestivum TaxID=4565 RepID=UPI001D00B8E7|nr:uncharacterized protein LOC123066385 [Triticum aestivum]
MDDPQIENQISDLSAGRTKRRRKKPGDKSACGQAKVPKIAHHSQQQEYMEIADRSHDNKESKIAHHSEQQEYLEIADRSHGDKVLKNLNQGNTQMQPNIRSFNEISEESDLFILGKQNLNTSNIMLVPPGAGQSYTELMQQMTVMSHLQSDNMAIPITSFTSFLTAGISSEECCITAIKNFKIVRN